MAMFAPVLADLVVSETLRSGRVEGQALQYIPLEASKTPKALPSPLDPPAMKTSFSISLALSISWH